MIKIAKKLSAMRQILAVSYKHWPRSSRDVQLAIEAGVLER
jgi:hypothetical protein